MAIEIGVTANNGQTLYHTALYEPSLQGADPWSRVIGYSFEIRSSWDLGSVSAATFSRDGGAIVLS